MASDGNPNSVSDAGVGALCARSAVLGAYLNVKINAGSLDDKAYVERCLKDSAELVEAAKQKESEILVIVDQKMQKA
jgi:glutamate formiminotransferase/formiminotetrahydrofolate cyclodeaminase